MSKMKDYFDSVEKFFLAFGKEEFDKIDECLICKEKNGDEELNTDGNIIIVKCANCGFVYNAYQPTVGMLNKFYSESKSIKKWSEIKDSVSEIGRQQSKYLGVNAFINKKDVKSVLDVGCGNGYFLNNVSVPLKIGIEPSDDAKRRCKFPVYNDYNHLMSSILQKKKFQMITLFGVLEHLKNPREELKRYYNLLEDGGYLAVIVPNLDSLIIDIVGYKTATFCPQHLWYFDPESLHMLMAECGFNGEYYSTTEDELQPILRKLNGIDPYKDIGIKLTHRDISEESIIENSKGYKIVSFFRK